MKLPPALVPGNYRNFYPPTSRTEKHLVKIATSPYEEHGEWVVRVEGGKVIPCDHLSDITKEQEEEIAWEQFRNSDD